MSSFNNNNPYGDRGEGGGREPGRRGLPRDNDEDVYQPSPSPPAAPSPSPPPPPRTLRPRTFALPVRSSATPAPSQPRPPPPPPARPPFRDLEIQPFGPRTFLPVAPNNMKLNRVLAHGRVLVNDVITYWDGTDILRLRITRIGHGGHIYLVYIDPRTFEERPFFAVNGREYFQNPADIVAALRAVNDGNNTATHWNALVLHRGGERVGTLNQVRERLRLDGSQKEEAAKDEKEDEDEDMDWVTTEDEDEEEDEPPRKRIKLEGEDEAEMEAEAEEEIPFIDTMANRRQAEDIMARDGPREEREWKGIGKGKKRAREEDDDDDDEDYEP